MNDLICFKGYRDGVTLILNDREPDFRKILKQLKLKMSHLNFFRGAVVNIDIGQREGLSAEQLDSLEEILLSRNIHIKNAAQNKEKPDAAQMTPAVENIMPEKGDTLMLRRTIRSGQNLYYPGNIMLLGDVHPGGEVIAEENIIVWGTLRGIVHAGSKGNKKAFIIALQLAPAQLRIAQYIACAPDQKGSHPPQKPEIAYLQDERIVISDYNENKNILAGFSEH
jgi:septum site-determining protein MinC